MTAKHKADELADEIKKERASEYVSPAQARWLFRFEKMLRTIPALEANLELSGKVNQDLMKHVHSLEAEIEGLKKAINEALGWVCVRDSEKPFTDIDICGEMVSIRLTGLCLLAEAVGKRGT